MNGPVASPVRGAVVEAVDSGGTTVRATTTTDATGTYTMQVQSGRNLIVRIKAQLLRASAGQGTPAWNFRVLNNTNGSALYALDSTPFTTGTAAMTVNLNAATGWGGVSYTGTRAAAPFSLLDVAYEVLTLVQTANANAAFAALDIFWSTQNRPVSTPFNPAIGNIGTTFYQSGVGGGVFVLGDANNDTDEFDQHVIAHELGHFFQDVFSRDDSVGGEHSTNQLLDLRVAFSEGWGNAFSGMVKNDPLYRDSFGAGQGSDFQIPVENNPTGPTRGWFSEASVQSLIWDFFDATADANDAVALGFVPIFTVMNTELRTNEPLSAIFPFVTALKTRNAGAAGAIDTLVTAQGIVSATIDDLGSTETNNGGEAMNLPVYISIGTTGTPVQVCSTTPNGEGNKLGNRKFLRFNVPTRRAYQIRAQSPATSDPDIVLHRQGIVAVSEELTRGLETMDQTLDPGNYIIEAYDFFAIDDAPHPDNPPPPAGPVCLNVTVITTI